MWESISKLTTSIFQGIITTISTPSSPIRFSKQESLEVQSELDHRVLFKFSRLSLQSSKSELENSRIETGYDEAKSKLNYEGSSSRHPKSREFSFKHVNNEFQSNGYPIKFQKNPKARNHSEEQSFRSESKNNQQQQLAQCKIIKRTKIKPEETYKKPSQQTETKPTEYPSVKADTNENIFLKFFRFSHRRPKPKNVQKC